MRKKKIWAKLTCKYHYINSLTSSLSLISTYWELVIVSCFNSFNMGYIYYNNKILLLHSISVPSGCLYATSASGTKEKPVQLYIQKYVNTFVPTIQYRAEVQHNRKTEERTFYLLKHRITQ